MIAILGHPTRAKLTKKPVAGSVVRLVIRPVAWLVRTVAAAALVLTVMAFGQTAGAEKLTIVTTIAQLADAAHAIAGERADVTSLMGEGVDPHNYQLTRTDVRRLATADIVFWNGLFLEAQLEDFLVDLSTTKPVIALGETLDPARLLSPEGFAGHYDPHIWMDPRLWSEIVVSLRKILAKADPDGAKIYQKNAEAYLDVLRKIDAYSETALSTVPAEKRVMISAHDAFNYFGRRYNFEVIGIQGLSTASEAGLLAVENLVDLIVERKIQSVFAESSVSTRNVRALIEGAAARGQTTRVGGQLYSDAMGAPTTYEGTYLGMLDHNVTTITRALGGTAPQLGFGSKLRAGG